MVHRSVREHCSLQQGLTQNARMRGPQWKSARRIVRRARRPETPPQRTRNRIVQSSHLMHRFLFPPPVCFARSADSRHAPAVPQVPDLQSDENTTKNPETAEPFPRSHFPRPPDPPAQPSAEHQTYHALLTCPGNETELQLEQITYAIRAELEEVDIILGLRELAVEFRNQTANRMCGPFLIASPNKEAIDYLTDELGAIQIFDNSEVSITFEIKACTPDGNPIREYVPRESTEVRIERILREGKAKDEQANRRKVVLTCQLPKSCTAQTLESGALNIFRDAIDEKVKSVLEKSNPNVRIEQLDSKGRLRNELSVFITFRGGTEFNQMKDQRWQELKYIPIAPSICPLHVKMDRSRIKDFDIRACCFRSGCAGVACTARKEAYAAAGYTPPLPGETRRPPPGMRVSVFAELKADKRRLREAAFRCEVDARKEAKLETLCEEFKKGKVSSVSLASNDSCLESPAPRLQCTNLHRACPQGEHVPRRVSIKKIACHSSVDPEYKCSLGALCFYKDHVDN